MNETERNKLRHEIYSILTDQNSMYIAESSHLKELYGMMRDSEQKGVIQCLKESSREYSESAE